MFLSKRGKLLLCHIVPEISNTVICRTVVIQQAVVGGGLLLIILSLAD
jgi:hypothetical protein